VFPPEALFPDPADKSIHIPVAAFGIAGYALIAVLALARRYWLTLAATLVGLGFAGYLSYLEWRVIDKWCIYCVWSQAIIAAILLCTIAAILFERRGMSRSRAATVATA
jgi:vitamin-K-epoxide reductase (warfarin-sensitive)